MIVLPSAANARTLIGTVDTAKGGTGAPNPSGARANLQTTGPAVRSAGLGSVQISPAGRVVIAPGLNPGTGAPIPAKSHNAFPALCKTATGRLMVLYRNGVAHADPNSGPGSTLVTRFSDDLGATWTAPTTLYTDATGDVRDSSLWRITQGPNAGRIFAAPIVNTLAIPSRPILMYSDDHGATWTSPVSIYDQARWGASGRQDFTSSPIELADGTLLWACYGFGTPPPAGGGYIASVYRSTDHGLTWSWLSTIHDGTPTQAHPEEPCLALLDDGSILASVRYDDDLTIRFFKSTDNGATWTNPSAPIAVVNGCGRPSILQMTNAAPGTPGAIVCVTRGAQPTYPGQQTIVYTSRDRGVTWTGPVTMDERTLPDFVYAGLVEVSPGVIGCAYAVEYPSTGAYAELDFIYLTDGAVRDPLGGATHVAIAATSYKFAGAPQVWTPPIAMSSGATTAQLEAQLNSLIRFLGATGAMPPHPLSLASCFGLWEAENVPISVNDWSGTMATVSDLTRLDGGTLSGSALAGTWGISGGALKLSANASLSAFAWNPGKADLTFKVKFTYASGATGVVFRAVDGSNLLTVKMASSFTKLYKRVAGTETQLAAGATVVTGAGDYWCQVTLAGASIQIWIWPSAGSQPATPTLSYTLTSGDQTTFLTPTKHGVGADDTNQAFSNVSFTLGLAENDPVGYLPDTNGLLAAPFQTALNLTQATVSLQPTWGHLPGYFRGYPALQFTSGALQRLVSPTFTANAQPNALVGIFYVTANATDSYLAGQVPDGGVHAQSLRIGSSNKYYAEAGTALLAPTAETFPSGPNVMAAIFNGASSSVRKNGLTLVTGDTGAKTWNQVMLGAASNASRFYCVGFAALHGAAAAADALAVERYFAAKYGILLGS